MSFCLLETNNRKSEFVNLRMEPDLMEQIRIRAKEDDASISSTIRELIVKAIE